jgi:hypothetical protein
MRLTSERKNADRVLFSLANRTPLDSTSRPIGEVMPVVLARYKAGPYRFRSLLTHPSRGDEAQHETAFAPQALATGDTVAAG